MKLLARVCFDDLEAKNFYRLREIFQALLSSSLEYPNVNVHLDGKNLMFHTAILEIPCMNHVSTFLAYKHDFNAHRKRISIWLFCAEYVI